MKAITWTWIAWVYSALNLWVIGIHYNKSLPIDWVIIFVILAIATFKDAFYEDKKRKNGKIFKSK